MSSRRLLGRSRAQDHHSPSLPEAPPGASSRRPSTQCARRGHGVPSGGHTACLVFPGFPARVKAGEGKIMESNTEAIAVPRSSLPP